mmetsp:Transcript_95389/g.269994  ORF Transcript_95389/g.269994 Transcript_95389/m.269994 type:complete len:171 (-) Transcript_95389:407-919(-)|eukprot:CAMPEP_0179281638 /NCGR_PEP_ID=MMETSP0797-20121207/37258_1 /TAXON_ID=47934 /ORGANISM="Dinophysis acuminata, Strain DAEP01" /LENGTH=170 /DNA_ID=CAMNT_0020990355 /DNA_START=59 /DNA_END=571 /DNA_ORIENTATION=-
MLSLPAVHAEHVAADLFAPQAALETDRERYFAYTPFMGCDLEFCGGLYSRGVGIAEFVQESRCIQQVGHLVARAIVHSASAGIFVGFLVSLYHAYWRWLHWSPWAAAALLQLGVGFAYLAVLAFFGLLACCDTLTVDSRVRWCVVSRIAALTSMCALLHCAALTYVRHAQ